MARKKITEPVHPELAPAQPARAIKQRTAQDEQLEIDDLYAILLSVQQEGTLFFDIPCGPVKRVCSLFPRRGQDDMLQSWVMGEYRKKYGDRSKPLLMNYKEARSRLKRETPISASEQEPTQEEKPKTPKVSARTKKLEEIAQCNTLILASADDFKVPGREMGVRYVRVPYRQRDPGLTGLWRIDDQREPIKLLDCAFQFRDIERPHTSSKSTDYAGTIIATNTQGETKTFLIDKEAIEQGGLEARLKGFANWPHVTLHKQWLQDALDLLMREKGVIIHDKQESLGWVIDEKLGLVWVANNGIETAQDFIATEQAPFVAPTLLTPGNGYRALTARPSALNETIWQRFLGELNSRNWARVYAKLGAYMRLLFPEGTIEHAGKLNFAIETVGDGTGQGKSAEDNFILSLYGTDFPYNRATYLTSTDSVPSRARVMGAVRYCLFADYDHKARPGNPQFHRHHEARKLLIAQYADDEGGGLIVKDKQRNVGPRGNPQGGPLLTGNYDHSAYAIQESGADEEASEFRFCTFTVESDERANYDISIQIDAQRFDITAWGTQTRQWLMQQFNADKHALTQRILQWKAEASNIVDQCSYLWPHSRPMNVCIDLVWGILAWQAFLEDTTQTYQDSYLWQFFHTFTKAFIDNRYERAMYLQSLLDARTGGQALGDFVLESLRYLFAASDVYVTSQQDEILREEDVPFSLTRAGMSRDLTTEGHEFWRTGRKPIGHYLPRKGVYAFDFNVLYPELERIAQRQKYPLSRRSEFKKHFAETGIPLVKKDDFGNIVETDIQAWIKRKNGPRYVAIPLSLLYPASDVTEHDEEESEDTQTDVQQEHKVITFPGRGDVQAQPVQESGPDVPYDPFDISPENVPVVETLPKKQKGKDVSA